MNDLRSPASDENIRVRRGRVDAVVLYEVREDELESLERGGISTLQISLSSSLITLAVAFTIALLTSDFKQEIVRYLFGVAAFSGFVLGLYFGLVAYLTKSSVKKIGETIRKRLNGSIQRDSEDSESDDEDYIVGVD